MKKIKRFMSTAITYLAGNVLSKLVTLFLIPLYTNKLSTSQYGEYDLVITIITLFVSLAFFQVWDGMFRFSFDFEQQEKKYHLVNNALVIYLFGILIYCVLFVCLIRIISIEFWIYSFVYGICFALQYMYSFMARIFLKNKLFVFSGTLNTLTVALSNIILILAFDVGVKSLYISQILGCILQIIVIEKDLKTLPRFKLSSLKISWMKSMLKFSIPLCISTISYWLLTGFTKVVISKTLGPTENGIYAIASTLSNLTVMVVNVFQYAWNELSYMMAQESNRKAVYKQCVDLLFVTVIIGTSIVCIGVKVIFPYLVGTSFQSSQDIIPILMIGVSSNAIAGFLGTLFMTEKRTSFILYSTIFPALLNAVCSPFATKRFGLLGAVITLSVSFILLMLVRVLFMNIILAIYVNPKVMLLTPFIAISLILYMHCHNIAILVGFGFLMLFCYFGIIIKVFGIRLYERKR